MAEEKKTVILEVEFDNQKAQKNLIETEKSLQRLKDERKELRKQLKQEKGDRTALTSELVKNEKEIRKLNKVRRQEIKEVDASKNSIDALRAQIGKLNQERNKLDTSTEAGRKEFAKLTDELEKYNQTLRDVGKDAGQFKDNIGNYTASIKEAIAGTNVFGVSLGSLGEIISKNPIFILVSILTAVVAAFNETEEGAAEFAGVLAGFKIILEPIIKLFESLGAVLAFIANLIIDVFGGAAAATRDLAREQAKLNQEYEKNELAVNKAISAIEKLKLVRDDETRAEKDRLKAAEAINKEIDKLDGQIKNREKSVKVLEKELKILKGDLVTRADIVNEIKKENEVLKSLGLPLIDINKATEKRLALVEEYGLTESSNSSILAKQKEIQEVQNQLIEEEARKSGLIAENLSAQIGVMREKRDLQNEILDLTLEEDILLGKVIEGSQNALDRKTDIIQEKLKNNLLSLIRNEEVLKELQNETTEDLIKQLGERQEALGLSQMQITTFVKQANVERLQAQKDANEKAADLYQKQLEEYKRIQEEQTEFLKNEESARLQIIRNNTLEGSKERVQAEIELQRFENEQKLKGLKEGSEQRKLAQNQADFELFQIRNSFTAEVEEAERQSQMNLLDIRVQTTDGIIANIERTSAAESAAAKSAMLIQQRVTQERKEGLNALRDITGQAAELFGEQTAAGKFFAIASATIDTYKAANLALSTLPPPFGAIAAALSVATGLKNVASIASTPTEGFASGGFTGTGNDMSPAGIVHKNEYVIPAKMVRNPKYSGMINTLENDRLNGYATGGMVTNEQTQTANQAANEIQSFNRLIKSMPAPQVSVRDINTVAKAVKVKDDFSKL